MFPKIAGVNYGGHVTDDWDRKVLYTYINDFFHDEAIDTPFFKLAHNPQLCTSFQLFTYTFQVIVFIHILHSQGWTTAELQGVILKQGYSTY